MSLVQIKLPLGSFSRLVTAVERVAAALERAWPSPLAKNDPRGKEPTDGITIVTDEMVLEEEAREQLRLQGYMPDDINDMVRRDGANSEGADEDLQVV